MPACPCCGSIFFHRGHCRICGDPAQCRLDTQHCMANASHLFGPSQDLPCELRWGHPGDHAAQRLTWTQDITPPPYIAEHMERPAKVTGPVWAWCTMTAHTRPPEGNPGAPMAEWEVIRPAQPHDAHLVNAGNTMCGGYPGTVPMTPQEILDAKVEEIRERVEHSEAMLAQALRTLDRDRADLSRATMVATYARSLRTKEEV